MQYLLAHARLQEIALYSINISYFHVINILPEHVQSVLVDIHGGDEASSEQSRTDTPDARPTARI